MSVEPVNQNNALSSAAMAGVGAGVVGGLGGYLFGGKRPSLEEVFAMPNDTFEAVAKKAEGEDVTKAMQDITNARAVYGEVVKTNDIAISNAAKDKESLVRALPVEETLTQKVSETKAALEGKKVKVGDTDLTYSGVIQTVKDKKSALKSATTDETKATAKAELEKAVNQAREFFKGAKAENDAYNNARTAVRNAQVSKFNEAAKTADSAAAKANKAVTEAIEAKKKAVSGKVEELVKNENVQTAFGKVKNLFDKVGKGKAAAWTAAIAAVVVGAITYFVKNNQKDAA